MIWYPSTWLPMSRPMEFMVLATFLAPDQFSRPCRSFQSYIPLQSVVVSHVGLQPVGVQHGGGGGRGGVPPVLRALVPSLVWGFGVHSVRSGHDRFLVQISESAVCFLAIILALTALSHEVVFHISSIWVETMLHTKNQLPRLLTAKLRSSSIYKKLKICKTNFDILKKWTSVKKPSNKKYLKIAGKEKILLSYNWSSTVVKYGIQIIFL